LTATIYEGKSNVLTSYRDISSSSLLEDDEQVLQIDYSNNNSQAHDFKSLDIAEGLKDLLIFHGFTIELLLSISATELSNTLGIDEYVANIICQSANRLVSGLH
jgi:hypothetical protein